MRPISNFLVDSLKSKVLLSKTAEYNNLNIQASSISMWFERWFLSSNAKDIGVLYLIYALFSGLVGTAFSVLIRLELSGPGVQYIADYQLYNSIITAHAIIMIFFMVMPALIGGFGNFLLPLGLGGPDMAFPRLNNISYLSLIPSIVLFLFAGVIENGAGTGWTLGWIKELFYGDIKQSKLFSMREYLQVFYVIIGLHVIHYSCLILIKILLNSTYVRMCISWRQCAWIVNKHLFTSHQRLNEEHLNDNSNMISLKQYKNHNAHIKDEWEQWLVGFTDGDGNFHISHQGDKWGLSYKLTQSRYNIRVLHYIKKQLGVGSITKDGTKGQYFIRDRKIIENVIIPIFDKYPLLTTKYFDYVKLKKALVILNNNSLSKEDKNLKLLAVKNYKANSDYISPAWNNAILPLTDVSSINNVMSKSWLVGFIEAEGSFYLTNKASNRIVHGFGLTQKLDKVVLDGIGIMLHISNPVKFKELHNHYILDTTNSRAIENIILFFKDTMKGVKSLEYRIWARSYVKNKGDYNKLLNVRNIIRELRKNLLEIK
jgi:Cytochrome C and Quinol oxidase polypeptide I/LAGLIDADG endonuclease